MTDTPADELREAVARAMIRRRHPDQHRRPVDPYWLEMADAALREARPAIEAAARREGMMRAAEMLRKEAVTCPAHTCWGLLTGAELIEATAIREAANG